MTHIHTVAKSNDTWAVVFNGRVVEDEIRSRAAAQQIAHAYNIVACTTASDLREAASLALIDAESELRAELAEVGEKEEAPQKPRKTGGGFYRLIQGQYYTGDVVYTYRGIEIIKQRYGWRVLSTLRSYNTLKEAAAAIDAA